MSDAGMSNANSTSTIKIMFNSMSHIFLANMLYDKAGNGPISEYEMSLGMQK